MSNTTKPRRVVRSLSIALGTIVAAGAGGAVLMASRYEPLTVPGAMIGPVDVGGLTRTEAEDRLRTWWEKTSSSPLVLTSDELEENPEGLTPQSLGIDVDLQATLSKVPLEDFWAMQSRKLTRTTPEDRHFEPVVTPSPTAAKELAQFVDDKIKSSRPASADYVNGQIVTTREQSRRGLDASRLDETLRRAVLTGSPQEVPLTTAQPKVSDEDLAQITEVVAEYTSRYSEGNANRASNIKNAAKRMTGTILMPGDTFSFNGHLGRRTVANGFKIAGVYNNGRHDFDIGGGICQVSGTLYNAVLLANLEIVKRYNHTYPVPYLPVGRDATVSYPAPDFQFRNNTEGPIAIAVQAGGGQITFRVLGKKVPGQEVKLSTAGHRSWGNAVKIVNDPSLPPGKRVVEEPGGAGHSIVTYRTVYLNGEEVKRETLGTSHYPGGKRIVRVNQSSPKPATTTDVTAKPIDDEHPDSGGVKPAGSPVETPPPPPTGAGG